MPIGRPLKRWMSTMTLSASSFEASPTTSAGSVTVSNVSWFMKLNPEASL